jgi:hypothetical protein
MVTGTLDVIVVEMIVMKEHREAEGRLDMIKKGCSEGGKGM